MFKFLASSLLIAMICAPLSAQAGALDPLFGERVRLEELDQDQGQRLEIDGQTVLTNYSIAAAQTGVVDGVDILLGMTGAGGNACGDSPFMISNLGGTARTKLRFDGPIGNCRALDFQFEADRVLFQSDNVPGFGQERWQWTPLLGFKALETLPFEPEKRTNWSNLHKVLGTNPSDVFKDEAIYAQLKNLLGADFEDFAKTLSGVGSAEFDGEDYRGNACASHSCTIQEALIFLATKEHKAFAALKMPEKDIRTFPAIEQWPPQARDALRNWAETWN